jgi:anhydro-N-acetylmuramic acid kinase
MKNQSLKILGLMSGTSLDGLDLALCSFNEEHTGWQYTIHAAETIPYSLAWKSRLSDFDKLSAFELCLLDQEYGHYLGQQSRQFLHKNGLHADYISSHGHTLFHRPDLGLTFQAGSGATLSAASGLAVVCDFRTQDVGLGGQGAPLVPIGDQLLFWHYTSCLNLGGFSNISYQNGYQRLAFDVSPCNLVMNALSQKLGKDYDEGGAIAASGKIEPSLLDRLNMLDYYMMEGPKSLGREWVETMIYPLFDEAGLSIADAMRTFVAHISEKIAAAIRVAGSGDVLVTGGGARNNFLIRNIREKSGANLVIPETLSLDFKEALIFAFLGLLRITGRNNVLSSVTGSAKDHCGGSIYLP